MTFARRSKLLDWAVGPRELVGPLLLDGLVARHPVEGGHIRGVDRAADDPKISELLCDEPAQQITLFDAAAPPTDPSSP